jgi:hypothetical protein
MVGQPGIESTQADALRAQSLLPARLFLWLNRPIKENLLSGVKICESQP